jgi:hypothetical protein
MFNSVGAASDNAYAIASRERKSALGSEFYSQFSQLAKGKGGLILLRSMFETLKQLLVEYEHDFIAQLLFPEFYPPARYPIHFPIPTCVFETVEYGFIQPNNNGNFSMMVYPKRIGAYPDWSSEVFVEKSVDSGVTVMKYTPGRLVSPAIELYNSEKWTPQDWKFWTGVIPPDDINVLYQQLRLCGCVIKLQYMSRLDEVSGFLTSCLDYKHTGFTGNDIIQIDYGIYKRITHPLEGVRAVWFPKDNTDEEFEDVSAWAHEFKPNEGSSISSLEGIFTRKDKNNSNYDMRLRCNVGDSVEGFTYYHDGPTAAPITAPEVSGARLTSGTDSSGPITAKNKTKMDQDAIMIYGMGLQKQVGVQFRVELIRHWEGIPWQRFRQYLYGEKPFTSQKGYDAMKTMGNAFPFFANLTNMEATGAKDVLEGRIGELDPTQARAVMAGGGGDQITTIANLLA